MYSRQVSTVENIENKNEMKLTLINVTYKIEIIKRVQNSH